MARGGHDEARQRMWLRPFRTLAGRTQISETEAEEPYQAGFICDLHTTRCYLELRQATTVRDTHVFP